MAIDPRLVSIKKVTDIPTVPLSELQTGQMFGYTGTGDLKKVSTNELLGFIKSGNTGFARNLNGPTPYDAVTYPDGLYESYKVVEPITSPNNWGNLTVTQTELDENTVFFNVENGVVSKFLQPSIKGLDGDTSKLTNWEPVPYSLNVQKVKDNVVWENVEPVLGTDIPDDSIKWVAKIDNRDIGKIKDLENYILKDSNLFNPFLNVNALGIDIDKVALYTGGSETVAGYASQKVDKNVMIKLRGGAKYSIVNNYIGLTVADFLYDDNLVKIRPYSEFNGNAVYNVPNITLEYEVDLTTEPIESIFWLKVNFKYYEDYSKINLFVKPDRTFKVVSERELKLKSDVEIIKEDLNYIEGGTEFFDAVKYTKLPNLIINKFMFKNGSIQDTTGFAIPILNKDFLIELYGGGIYDVTTNPLTESSADILYDSNLDITTIYARDLGNVELVEDFVSVKFTVDLSNRTGKFYLRLGLRRDDDVNFNLLDEISVKSRDLFRSEKSASDDLSFGNVFKNNLKTQLTSFNLGSQIDYGLATAIYNFKAKANSRLSCKFKFKKDVNSSNSKVPIVRFLNGDTEIGTAGLLKAKPNNLPYTFLEETSFTTAPIYKSGYYIGTTDYEIDNLFSNPIVGDSLFSMWYKGNPTEEYPTEAEMVARSAELGLIQDLCIVIDSNNFSLIRDGKNTINETFYGSTPTTIFSTSLKSGSNFKSLTAFYDELKDEPLLSDFVFRLNNASQKDTTEVIQQVGKIHLISKNKSQVKNDTRRDDPTFMDYYDSFPFYFTHKIDFKEHILDIVSDGVNFILFIDGQKIGENVVSQNIELSNASQHIDLYDLEYFLSDYGDAEIKGNVIISERTPYVMGLMGHSFEAGYYSDVALSQTVSRMADVIKDLKAKGYTVYNAKDIADWSVGSKKLNKRSAFFIFDDLEMQRGYFDNLHYRNSFDQFGIPITFAMIVRYTKNITPSLAQKISTLRLNGHDVVSHSMTHDVPMSNKNSVLFWAELSEAQSISNDYNFFNRMFCYNWHGGPMSTNAMMKDRGYNCGVNSDGGGNISMTNNMLLNRENIGHDKPIEYVTSKIL